MYKKFNSKSGRETKEAKANIQKQDRYKIDTRSNVESYKGDGLN